MQRMWAQFKVIMENIGFKSPNEVKQKRKTIVVNLLGGPGCGKSTIRAGVFYFLKCSGLPCEEAIEYAKGKVYEGSDPVLKNQIYVFGKQHHITFRSMKHVDVIISESPLLLSIVYDIITNGKDVNSSFRKMVIEEHDKFDNMNYVLTRPNDRPYQEFGRTQTKDQAKGVDKLVMDVLEENKIDYTVLPSTHDTVMKIVEDVLKKINELDNE